MAHTNKKHATRVVIRNNGIKHIGNIGICTVRRMHSRCMGEEEFTKEEVRKAIMHLKAGKPEVSEMVKIGDEAAAQWIWKVYGSTETNFPRNIICNRFYYISW